MKSRDDVWMIGWPLSRKATSILCLLSRRTMRQRTRRSPGADFEINAHLIFFLQNPLHPQRDPWPSARSRAGAWCYEHHQRGGGRLRRHHHLNPGGRKKNKKYKKLSQWWDALSDAFWQWWQFWQQSWQQVLGYTGCFFTGPSWKWLSARPLGNSDT